MPPLPTTSPFVDLTLLQGIALGEPDQVDDVLKEVAGRTASVASEHTLFREWCIRADALYYATTFTQGGADLWPDDPSATTDGRSHVSVNTPSVYVDIPAALQAVEPIENMLATEDSEDARTAANALERIRKSWKSEEKWNLKRHKVTTVKALYGATSGFVYYDEGKGRPCVDVVEQPRNLYLGYKTDDFDEVEWAAYVTRREPNAVVERFGATISGKTVRSSVTGAEQRMPWITSTGAGSAEVAYPENFGPARIEVWDYWYRRPRNVKRKFGKPVQMETWNIVIAGNAVVSGPTKYPMYDGVIPYVPVRNTFIPGSSTGRGELHDMEQLIREKMERITGGAQMIAGATAGDFWQLTGQDAPSRVPPGAKPKRGEVATPGAGNRIEAIVPFIAQFQLEQYLGRIDREMAVVSGLNDLLLGLAPAQVLSSSKAINALIANYESRLSMRRLLLYSWDSDVWTLVLKVWAKKATTVKAVLDAGGGTLDIIDPSLSPRDEMETATRAANLVGAKLWTQARGMDATGVDDPEQEQNIIREESTDATLWPDRVMVMAQLLSTLQATMQPTPGGVQSQAQGQVASGQAALQAALGGPAGQANAAGAPAGGDTALTPPGAIPAGGTQSADAPFAQGPVAPQPTNLQGMIQNGKSSGRLLTSTKFQGRK